MLDGMHDLDDRQAALCIELRAPDIFIEAANIAVLDDL